MINVHLYSAGVDSFIGSLYLLHEKIDESNYYPVYFDLGHKYAKDEIITIKKTYPQTQIIENVLYLANIENIDAHIPFRNVLLITTIASLYAYANDVVKIFINSMADDMVSDQGTTFIKQMNYLLNYHRIENTSYVVSSSMPITWTKFDALDWFLNKGYPTKWLLTKTFSCYNPTTLAQPCYKCNACFRRNTLLYYGGIKLPFYNKDLVEQYYEKAKNHFYPEKRDKAILSYVDWLTNKGYYNEK